VTAGADQADLAELAVKVRELAAGDADPTQAKATVDGIFAALAELSERRERLDDPRRRQALELAKRIARARDAGASIEQLAGRFNRSPSRIYRLPDAGARHRALNLVLNPPESSPADQEQAR
jgi:hypothetical protein